MVKGGDRGKMGVDPHRAQPVGLPALTQHTLQPMERQP